MRHSEKRFLSDCSHETGTMVCTVETDRVKDLSDWVVQKGGSMTAGIQVRDCNNRPVYLDFDCTGQKNFEKRLDKLDGMIAQLERMRTQYHEMWWSHLRDIEFYKAEKAKPKEKQ